MDHSLLAQSPIFKGLDENELARVAQICETTSMKYDEFVFREGEEGDRLYIIGKGEVRISRDVPGMGEEAVAVLKQGACFGEMAVLDRSQRSTDAIVESACDLVMITRTDFEALLASDPALAHKVLWSVIRLLCHRLRNTNDSLQSILIMAMF